MNQQKNELALLFNSSEFVITFELVPSRSTRTRQYKDIINFISKVSKENLPIKVFTITDNAGGNPALTPSVLGNDLKTMGFIPIVHFSCKDKNRNAIESKLFALDREGLHNLLIMTGDYPRYGFFGKAKPVFDLDAVSLLYLITEIEKGIELPSWAPGGGVKLAPIPFYKGAIVNPFKILPAELFWQYVKFYRKFKAKAYFFITQVGFHPQGFADFIGIIKLGFTRLFAEYLQDPSIYNPEDDKKLKELPILAGLFYVNEKIARIFKNNNIPGIYFRDDFYNVLDPIDSLAKFMYLVKELRYKGVHLCGLPLKLEKFQQLLEKFNNYLAKKPELDKLFGISPKNQGVSQPYSLYEVFNRNKKESPVSSQIFRYKLYDVLHYLFFSKTSPIYPQLKKLALFIDRHERIKNLFTRTEYFFKKLLFNCQECGDCFLPEVAYLCPQSQCAKFLVNGPCGGSWNGYCEVYPRKKICVYVRAYERLKKAKKLNQVFKISFVPPRNWALYKTSSWLNFYLDKDHHFYLTK